MRIFPVRIIVAIAVIVGGCARSEDSFEAAFSREDWANVLEFAKPGPNAPAEIRISAAHASLALNRNNEATCLLSALSPDDLVRWDVWTVDFLNSHLQSATAHYLRGDAMARLNRFEGDAEEFNRSLELDEQHVLSLNARGVVRSLLAD